MPAIIGFIAIVALIFGLAWGCSRAEYDCEVVRGGMYAHSSPWSCDFPPSTTIGR